MIVLRDIWIIESTDPGCLFTFSFKDFYLARYLLIQTESHVPASIHMISLSCVRCIALYVYVYTQVLKQIENNIDRRERKWQSCCIHSYNFPLFSTWQLEGSIHIIATSQLKVPPTSFIIYSIKVHFFLLSLLETTTSETKLLVVFIQCERTVSQ